MSYFTVFCQPGGTFPDFGDNVLMDLDDDKIPTRVPSAVVGDVIPGAREVLDIRQIPQDAENDLEVFSCQTNHIATPKWIWIAGMSFCIPLNFRQSCVSVK